MPYENAPIHYHTAQSSDAIAVFARRVESGDESIQWDQKSGWLKGLLSNLDVPESSQTLVFSKTSLQISKVSAQRPRAVYFSDDVYIGWVQNGGVIEVSAVDKTLGPVFYSIRQTPKEFSIRRDAGECMSCHATSRTKNVPGYLVRSVFPDQGGTPFYGLGTTTTDHATPLEDRFGGWYVTGSHGDMRHRGNAIATEGATPPIDAEKGANRQSLDGLLRTAPYLQPSSDIVALMVLEHQTQMHNLITRAQYEARLAQFHDRSMNRLLERDQDHVSDSTRRRIKRAGDQLVDYMLMKDEWKLTSPIKGTSTFAADFQRGGSALRQLDLTTRLFKYPCSFLIESESYAGLPAAVRDYTEQRLADVLSGRAESDDFQHVDPTARRVIHAALSKSLPGFAERL